MSIHKLLLISAGWNRRVPLYTEASSFQGVGVEGFHCLQRFPYFSLGFHCIERCPYLVLE